MRTKFLLVLGVSVLSMAGAAAAEGQPGYWAVFAGQHAFADSRWQASLDMQARYSDLGSGYNQLVFRPSISYKLTSGVTLAAGYGRFRTHTANGGVNSEDRAFQDVAWTLKQGHGQRWSARLRFEQRFVSQGDDVALVARLQLGYSRALARDGRQLIASFEPFIDARDTDWGIDRGLNQARVYLGVRQALSDRGAFEIGYQNQFFIRDNREDLSNHLLMLFWRQRF